MKNKIDIEHIPGLSEADIMQRLKNEGFNELPSQKKRNMFYILMGILCEPMLLLLLGSGGIYLFLGDIQDAVMLVTFIFAVIGITFYQERKTERALDALRNLSSPRALVIRDGKHRRISGREVLTGDILILKEGDRIPADAVMLSCSNLLVDESLLTGESMPVRKSEWDGDEKIKHPGGDDLPFIYSATLVVQGFGIAKVIAAGLNTEIGKIGKALETINEEETILQKEIKKIVRDFLIIGAILCVLIVIIYGLLNNNWLHGILSGLTLSMAVLPEEFPVVLTVFLALGAWRISKHQVLTRRTPAIETLGAATVLCTDKTGTLTLNNMRLSALYAGGEYYEIDKNKQTLPGSMHDIIEYSILASQKDPFDPIEKEVKSAGEFFLLGTEHIHNNWTLVHEYPLLKQLLAVSHVWESPDKQKYIIATKGSPEAIIDLCHFNEIQKQKMIIQIENMAKKGLRVLGVAKAYFKKIDLPQKQHDFSFEFIGLIGFIDPVRPTVTNSISMAYKAGIRVIMITGDYPGTAQHIAKQIGLKNYEEYITGPELEKMDSEVLKEKIKTINIFARVVPEQKLKIVNALKANGEIVAMTGDGVNDAPALKAAHIGIAMGERGTDVARESASLVLLNDDFSSIVQAVKMGRRIFDNLKKAISYIFAVHIPIAGLSFLPVLFKMPIALLPAHIAFLELIIDPACSIVFESDPEEPDIMQRPPRSIFEPLLSKKTVIKSIVQGLSILIITFGVYIIALYLKKGAEESRTLAFATLVFANIMLIIKDISISGSISALIELKNKALWYVSGGALGALFAVIYIPFLRNLFHFHILSGEDLLITFISGIASLLWFDLLKIIYKRPQNGKLQKS